MFSVLVRLQVDVGPGRVRWRRHGESRLAGGFKRTADIPHHQQLHVPSDNIWRPDVVLYNKLVENSNVVTDVMQ